ncbi:MAG TPA: hypothetical protein VF602_10010 [Pedobacter sp.]|jgi:hypothetical protein
MHIELSPKYGPPLENIISKLGLEAHLINSFNASGETITLSASKEELEKITTANQEDFESNDVISAEHALVTLEGLKSIIKDHLADRLK